MDTIAAPHVPEHPISLMRDIYKKILPEVHLQLDIWKRKAERIPDAELRHQALASMTSKQFHCEGGGVYALVARPDWLPSVVRFIVAYQTISDYLDNLCDRSVSLDEANFRQLHQSMIDAVTGTFSIDNYYQLQANQEDGGYLRALVQTCHDTLALLPNYDLYKDNIRTLCELYCDLQVYKHIALDKREQALHTWWEKHRERFPELEWYEFAAATGSTLGIFYYVALASYEEGTEDLNDTVFDVYFPYIQGLHILLDYLIDQKEDREEGDLNFCFYYPSEEEKLQRIEWITRQARKKASQLPNAPFHRMIVEGLLGMYLSSPKVKEQDDVLQISKRLLKRRKLSTWFFFLNAWYIHRKGRKI
ncbi:tetraprenyl-beta-curcumene synthase [Caldalkalibacillus thermarum]|uniref:tetraprenyl-beta-curcumene synthase family protein n=1 Tax=Caldalkalibacillus thermarum TaxID=296745 RepID=UPI00166DBDE4|nr:tetraprenyl-beta-curcumene synthase family protein [Caldalkalibacillus thermarum]GGK11944.1 tetraprenyl-beta-curcumene synthase [Caldalkalibacillus thermarum]